MIETLFSMYPSVW